MEVYGRLDVLFNNAGIGTPPVPLEDLTLEQWQSTVDTNLTAPFLCTQHAFRIMKDQTPRGGRIINNGSISATRRGRSPRPTPRPSTRITGLTTRHRARRPRLRHRLRPDRHRQRATPMTERIARPGVLQPNGTDGAEPRMDVQNVADAIVYMATCPPDANVLFMNIMATKMPFVGRG